MNSTVIYARVSSKDQEAEGFSIPAQRKVLQEYARKVGLTVIQEFTDVETAKKAGRTQFNKMLCFLHDNKHIKHILVEKTDRLLRNIADYAVIERLVERSEIAIHLVKENVILDSQSRSNEKFIFGIKTLMAKNYIDNLSEEVKKGMAEKAAQGTYPSWAPYGYVNAYENGKKFIKVDPSSAAYVKKMFELYATGSYSLLTLRKKMLADGMIYRDGKPFYKSTLENILKNIFYTGSFSWKGKRYDHASHEAIVSPELFQQVQRILINPHKSKSRKGLFPYSNMIACGLCGCRLTAEIKKGKYIYYHCTGKKGDCKQMYLRQEAIDQQFELLLDSIQVSEETQKLLLDSLRDSMKDKIEYHNSLVLQLEKQLKVVQERIDRAYLDKLDGKISEEFWQSCTKKWTADKEELLLKLLALQKADIHYMENAGLILELAKKASTLFKAQSPGQKRRVIDLITSNCSYKDGKLDVELKPVFGLILKSVKTKDWCALSDYLRNNIIESGIIFGIRQLLNIA